MFKRISLSFTTTVLTLSTMTTALLFVSTDLMAAEQLDPVELAILPSEPPPYPEDLLPEAPKVIEPTRHAAWAAAFINDGRIPEHDLFTAGALMGLEWQLCPQSQKWQMGIALRYDHSDLDSRESLGTDLDFDSIRPMIYTHIDFNNPFYLRGILSYAFNEYDADRDTGVSIAKGHYDGRQFAAKAELGYKWVNCNLIIRPELSVYYSDLRVDDYTETGAGLLNQFFDSESAEALKLGFDLNIAYQNVFPRAKVLPYIHAKIEHDTMYDPMQEFTANTVFGGGTAFLTPVPNDESTGYQVGAGIIVEGDHQVMIVMKYDYSFKSAYHEHAALLSIRHDW